MSKEKLQALRDLLNEYRETTNRSGVLELIRPLLFYVDEKLTLIEEGYTLEDMQNESDLNALENQTYEG